MTTTARFIAVYPGQPGWASTWRKTSTLTHCTSLFILSRIFDQFPLFTTVYSILLVQLLHWL